MFALQSGGLSIRELYIIGIILAPQLVIKLYIIYLDKMNVLTDLTTKPEILSVFCLTQINGAPCTLLHLFASACQVK